MSGDHQSLVQDFLDGPGNDPESRGMTSCIHCRHWLPKPKECRALPPAVLALDHKPVWPVTDPYDGCSGGEPLTRYASRYFDV